MLPLWDSQPHRRPAVVTAFLLAVILAAFVYEVGLSLSGQSELDAFIREFAVVPSRLIAGWGDERQWLTLVTALFLHGGVLHLLGNGWFLWVFGRSVESAIGPWRFGLIYFCAGLAGTAAQIAADHGSTVPMLGASGAISGIMGAYFALFPRAWIIALVPWVVPVLPIPALVFLFLWFLLQTTNGLGDLFAAGSASAGVAWWAHAGGFVAGIALARRRSGGTRRKRTR
ncbi:MAG TPA: rhomboid family intramembrane serine protease [Opitutaceae bacterium]